MLLIKVRVLFPLFFINLFAGYFRAVRANWSPEDTHILTWILKPKDRESLKQVWRQCWIEVYQIDDNVLDYIEEYKELPPNYVAIANIDPWCVQACQYKKLGLWDENGRIPNEQAFHEYNKKIAHVPARLMLLGLVETLPDTAGVNTTQKIVELLDHIKNLTHVVSKEVNSHCNNVEETNLCKKSRDYLDCYFFTMIRSRHYLLAKAMTPRLDEQMPVQVYRAMEETILEKKWQQISKTKAPPVLPADVKKEIDSWASKNLLKYFELFKKQNKFM